MAPRKDGSPTALAAAAALVGGLAAWWVSWFPFAGQRAGLAAPWQVAVAVVVLLVGCAASRHLCRYRSRTLWVTSLGATLGFWVPWVVYAQRTDVTGLYLVGALLLLIGLVPGTLVAGLLVDLVGRSRGTPAS